MMCLSSLSLLAQTGKLSGTITDKDGVPIPGVSIVLKGTMSGTISDIDGVFNIEAKENDILIVSFIGMQTQEVAVANQKELSVVLLEDTIGLDEVVAIGYGTKKKESLTSAISKVSAEEITTTTHSSLAQALQGKVAGLQIRQGSGEPGSFETSINIRGFGAPLYVIDGVARDGGSEFQRLNPEDIESISVIKDAAAAIYGLRAANGVVIVTTKKGKKGKTKFNLHSVVGFQKPTDVPEMASAAQYVEMVNNARINAGGNPTYSNEEVEKYQSGAPGYEGTDWFDETIKDFAFQQQHSISASGGSEKIDYFASFGYSEDQGLLKSNDMGYNKYTFKTNLGIQLTKNLKADISLGGRYDKKKAPGANFFNIYKATRIADPTSSQYVNGDSNYLSLVGPSNLNPVALADKDISGYVEGVNKNFQSSIGFTYEAPFLKGLTFKGLYSYDSNSYTNKSLQKSYELYSYDSTMDKYEGYVQNSPSKISNQFNDFSRVNLQTQIHYKTTVSKLHNLSAMLVYEQQETNFRTAWLERDYDFYTNDQIDQASQNNQLNSGYETETGSRSVIGRVNYDFASKYLIEFAFRYDGSYRYHPDNQWGFFPVVTGGWRLSEEEFFKKALPVVSNFKLRASYGVVGEDAGDPFQYVEGYSTSGGGGYEFVNGEYTTGAAAPSIVNEDLTWFKSRITNLGFDLGLWDNKLSIEFDVYQRNRRGLLAKRNVSLPNTFGGELPEENLNKDQISGLDFAMTYRNNIGDLKYEISGNLNYYRSKNLYVEQGEFGNSYDNWRNNQAYRNNDIVWGYAVEGQFQNEEALIYSPVQNGNLGNMKELPGDYQYKDANGDGVINNGDLLPLFYNATPKLHYGLSMSASWNGFDIRALWQGSGMYTVRFKEVYAEMFAFRGNTPAYFSDAWEQDSEGNWTEGDWPAQRYISDMGSLYAESSVWRKDATYLRLKSLELGYTFQDKAWMNKLGVDNIRIYWNGHNLLTFADDFVKPFDPEKIEGAYSAGLTYPLTKSYNMGVNITF